MIFANFDHRLLAPFFRINYFRGGVTTKPPQEFNSLTWQIPTTAGIGEMSKDVAGVK